MAWNLPPALWALVPALVCAAAPAPAPIRAGLAAPPILDLGNADPTTLIPADPRDPAQVEQVSRAWAVLLAPFKDAREVGLRLPAQGPQVQLLLAASQALKAAFPETRLLLAYRPGQAAIWDENAWGAVDAGLLLPGDLGPAPAVWRDRLARAQAQLPGRPWILWLDRDPLAVAGALLGDGGRLVVPAGGPGARLAQALPAGPMDLQGGLGEVTFSPRDGSAPQRWRFQGGEWVRAAPLRDRTEVVVEGQAAYDVGALLARVRASWLRNHAALRTLEGTLRVDLHVQKASGPGQDLGYRYDLFAKAGEDEQLVRREVLMNGVRANLSTRATLPIVEASVSVALPVALAPSEAFRYLDAGPGRAGCRRIRFEPVVADPALPRGELLVEEATGQVLREESHRDRLPGKVRTVDLTLDYGQVLPGVWRVVKATAFERWITASSVAQVQRRLDYSDLRPNAAGFEARREAARASSAFMLEETVAGVRYLEKQPDGSRAVNTRPSTRTRADVYGVFLEPGLSPPLLPLAGRMGADDNLGDRGIQFSYLTAILVNTAQLTIPQVGGGFDLGFNGLALLVPNPVLPVQAGRVVRQDEIGDYFGTLNVVLSRDLGAGLRASAEGRFRYDVYATRGALVTYATPGFQAPPDGLSREARARLLWQGHGFQMTGYVGSGQRPSGTYGLPGAPQAVPEEGRFQRWGVSAGYDLWLPGKTMFHLEGGDLGGHGVDRFKPLDLTDLGNATIVGFSPYVFTSEHAAYGKVALVLPPRPALRLTVGLEQARIRALDDLRIYDFTSLAVDGDLPGFWKFTSTRIDLGVGLRSTMAGARSVTGSILFLRVF